MVIAASISAGIMLNIPNSIYSTVPLSNRKCYSSGLQPRVPTASPSRLASIPNKMFPFAHGPFILLNPETNQETIQLAVICVASHMPGDGEPGYWWVLERLMQHSD